MTTDPTPDPDDGPECETCGKTTCPDADLPGFSEPRSCAYAPVYEALRYDRCEYGCGRDITNETIRRDVVPAVERIVEARVQRGAWLQAAARILGGPWQAVTTSALEEYVGSLTAHLAAVQSVLAEYDADSRGPAAPYTRERALRERLDAALTEETR